MDAFDFTSLEELTFVEHSLEADEMQGKVVMIFVVLSLFLVVEDLSLGMRTGFCKADHAAIIVHFVTRFNPHIEVRCYSKHPIELTEYALKVS